MTFQTRCLAQPEVMDLVKLYGLCYRSARANHGDSSESEMQLVCKEGRRGSRKKLLK